MLNVLNKKPLLPVNIKQFDGETITLAAVQKFLNDNKEDKDVKGYLGELSAVSAEKVEGFLDTEAGKKLLQPRLDSNFTKGLNTWKENNLKNLVEDEIKKRNPSETPEQKRIRELEEKITNAENESKREKLLNKAVSHASEKGLPTDIVSFFIGEDEDSTMNNLKTLEEKYNAAITKAVDAKFKESGRNPETGSEGGSGNGTIDLGKMADEISLTNN